MADKRISQLIERTDIANNDVLPIVASGATTTNKVTISTIQTWMQDNLDVGVTSVGLSMPSAFVVSNSPVTASGNITVTGAGTVAQYIRGDGSLADFPQSAGGGGASVSYYLNGSVSQGTIGGIAYLEMNKTPILAAGTDFTIAADGYIASFITDAGDPGLLEIPAGNWNFETYLSATSGGGSPTFYIELYKVNSGGTATLIASNSATPESISLGTNINPYFSALAVPTTTLALTDRLALRYYVTHAGRTITLHTENSHLCQIITTFTTGLTALNGLTAQVQNFATGTSGTDFNIISAGSTHTFNIPSASATDRGLVTTGSQTIAGAKTFSNDAVINGVSIGKGAGGSVDFAYNTAIGSGALASNTTGLFNTALGFNALANHTTGNNQVALGLNSGRYINSGANNILSSSSIYIGVDSRASASGNSNEIVIGHEGRGSGSNTVTIGNSSITENYFTGNIRGGALISTSDSSINGVSIGKGASSVATNTRLGFQTLVFNTTGSSNTSVGWSSLYLNTTGSSNSSFGTLALENNTTGTGNTSSGYASLRNNTIGGANTATGYVALSANTTGNANTATGAYALENNTTGYQNTSNGYGSLEENTTGNNNTGISHLALNKNTTGNDNTAVGTSALFANTTGSLNSAVGTSALNANTTGGNNTTLGHSSLQNNTTGGNNTAVGFAAGSVTNGGFNNATSSNSVYLGHDTRAGLSGNTNEIVIGAGARGNGSNTVVLGSDSITATFLKGAITLNGTLTGTSATFAGRARFQGTGYDTLGSAEIMLTNTTASTGRSFIVNSSNAGEFLISDVSAGQTRLSINSSGAVTLTGSLSGTSASFTGDITTNGTCYISPASGNALNVISRTSTSNGAGLSLRTNTTTNWLVGTAWGETSSNFVLYNAGTGTQSLKLDYSTNAATFTGALSGTSATFAINNSSVGNATNLNLQQAGSGDVAVSYLLTGTREWLVGVDNSDSDAFKINNITGSSDFNNTGLSIATTGAATFSSSVGIGIAPATALDVNGTINVRTNGFQFGRITTNNVSGDTGGLNLQYIEAGTFKNGIVINGGGNVGIGTPTPARKLQVEVGSEAQGGQNWSHSNGTVFARIGITNPGVNNNTEFGSASNNDLVLLSNNTERMRIKSNGDLKIQSGNLLGWSDYSAGSTGVGLLGSSENLQFYSSGTERMRITSGGFLKASNDSTYAGISSSYHEMRSNQNTRVVAFSNKSATLTEDNGILIQFAAASPNNTTARFIVAEDSTATRFVVYSNGNVQNQNNSYGSLSDIKLKENIEDATPKLDDLMKVKVRNYNFIGDDKKQIGLIAQELEEVFPAMIDETPDYEDVEVPQLDEEGNEVLNEEGEVVTTKERVSKGTTTKSVKYSVFVPMLIKAMQEQQEQIKSLTEQVEALKSQING